MHCRVLLIVIPVIYDIMSGGLSLRQCADQWLEWLTWRKQHYWSAKIQPRHIWCFVQHTRFACPLPASVRLSVCPAGNCVLTDAHSRLRPIATGRRHLGPALIVHASPVTIQLHVRSHTFLQTDLLTRGRKAPLKRRAAKISSLSGTHSQAGKYISRVSCAYKITTQHLEHIYVRYVKKPKSHRRSRGVGGRGAVGAPPNPTAKKV